MLVQERPFENEDDESQYEQEGFVDPDQEQLQYAQQAPSDDQAKPVLSRQRQR